MLPRLHVHLAALHAQLVEAQPLARSRSKLPASGWNQHSLAHIFLGKRHCCTPLANKELVWGTLKHLSGFQYHGHEGASPALFCLVFSASLDGSLNGV